MPIGGNSVWRASYTAINFVIPNRTARGGGFAQKTAFALEQITTSGLNVRQPSSLCNCR